MTKKITSAALLAILALSANIARGQDKANESIKVLKNYDGNYPHEVKLKENKELNKRLEKLLGNRFAFLKSKWGPEIPIEVKDSIFKSQFCEQHNCGDTNFIILYNFDSDRLCVGIRDNNQVTIFMESNTCPAAIEEWKEKNSE